MGAVFGLVFVLANAGDLAAPAVNPAGWRMYTIGVALEVVALVLGLILLNRSGHSELAVPWVAVSVGLHFVPLARAFRASFYLALGATLVLLGIVGGGLALAGAERWPVSLISGVASGAVLLVVALRPTIPERRPG